MTLVVAPNSNQRHSQNWTPDWEKLITRGVTGIREEAKTALEHLRDTIYKKPFIEAVIITCDAMKIWSERYVCAVRRAVPTDGFAHESERIAVS